MIQRDGESLLEKMPDWRSRFATKNRRSTLHSLRRPALRGQRASLGFFTRRRACDKGARLTINQAEWRTKQLLLIAWGASREHAIASLKRSGALSRRRKHKAL
jgi:hypothetical protein